MSAQWDKEDVVWVKCPCCNADFPFHRSSEVVQREQLQLQLEAHPEVYEDPLDKDVRERDFTELGDETGG